MRFLFNDKTDAVLIRNYQTYNITLDTEDYVSPKTNAFIRKFIDRNLKRSLRNVSKETRIKFKRFRAEAKINGLTLDEYLDILDAEERQRAIEAAVAAEPEKELNAGETNEETAQDDAEEPEENPREEDEPEQTG